MASREPTRSRVRARAWAVGLWLVTSTGCAAGLAAVAPAHDPANPQAPASPDLAPAPPIGRSAFDAATLRADGGHHHGGHQGHAGHAAPAADAAPRAEHAPAATADPEQDAEASSEGPS